MQRLIAFIESHGQVALEQDGELMVLEHAFGHNHTPQATFTWVRIDATARAAKDWLGY